jgi:hypothetical protein
MSYLQGKIYIKKQQNAIALLEYRGYVDEANFFLQCHCVCYSKKETLTLRLSRKIEFIVIEKSKFFFSVFIKLRQGYNPFF